MYIEVWTRGGVYVQTWTGGEGVYVQVWTRVECNPATNGSSVWALTCKSSGKD